VLAVFAAGCAAQSTDFETIEPGAAQSNEILVVVTPRSSNVCWTNASEVADAASRNLSAVYDTVSIATFEEANAGHPLVFQVLGWAYRRSGICFGNFRISIGEGLEVKDNGYIDTKRPAVTSKRKAILGAPAEMNTLIRSYVDEVSRNFASRVGEMR